jgi:hypothetical protein
MNNTYIPIELIEQIAKRNCVLFMGADICYGPQTPPSRKQLARMISERCGYPHPEAGLARVSQYYETMRGRNALVSYIREVVDNSVWQISPSYTLIAGLPWRAVVSASYDSLLERALDNQGIHYDRIVRCTDVPYTEDESKLLLVKAVGSIEQPDTLALSKDDWGTLFDTLPTIRDLLRYLFASKTLLFIGHDPDDEYFGQFYGSVLREIRPHSHRSYALWESPTDFQTRYWENKNIEIKDCPLETFFQNLQRRLQDVPTRIPARVAASVQSALPEPDAAVRPYKFLDYYETGDAGIFFGREAETRKLSQVVVSHRLTLLLGKSGVGKTSIVKAGLTPALSDEGFGVIYSRCGDNPNTALKFAMAAQVKTELPETNEPSKLVDLTQAAIAAYGKPIAVFFDQFEEFFVNLSDPLLFQFASELAECLANQVDARFILVIREDFMANLDTLRRWIPTIFNNGFRLQSLSKDDAREVIVRPLERTRIGIEAELASRLLRDLYHQDGIYPPHLQIVCERLYESLERSARKITLKQYQDLGGAERILLEYVDAVLKQMPEEERRLADAILKVMVTSWRTKMVLRAEEIATASWMELDEVSPILDKLVLCRLVRRIELSGIEYFELTHEHLVARVQSSIQDEERKVAEARELLRRQLFNWKRLGLWMDPQSIEIVHRVANKVPLTTQEVALLLASSIKYGASSSDYWINLLEGRNVTQDVADSLLPLLGDAEISVAQRALKALLATRSVEALHGFLSYLADQNELKGIRLLEPLNELVELDRSLETKDLAQRTHQETRAHETFIGAISNVRSSLLGARDEQVRIGAARILGALGRIDDIPILKAAADKDPSERVRSIAEESLGRHDVQMALREHLSELFWRLTKSVIALVVSIVVSLAAIQLLIDRVIEPLYRTFGFTPPPLGFVTRIEFALLIGLALMMPYLSWEISQFMKPALRESEQRILNKVLFITCIAWTVIPLCIASLLPYIVGELFRIGVLDAEWARSNLLGIVFKVFTTPPATLIFLGGLFSLTYRPFRPYIRKVRLELGVLSVVVPLSMILSTINIFVLIALTLILIVAVLRIALFLLRNPFVLALVSTLVSSIPQERKSMATELTQEMLGSLYRGEH